MGKATEKVNKWTMWTLKWSLITAIVLVLLWVFGMIIGIGIMFLTGELSDDLSRKRTGWETVLLALWAWSWVIRIVALPVGIYSTAWLIAWRKDQREVEHGN